MYKKILIAALAASISIPLALHAADEGKKKGNPFAAADKDHDGKLSKSEFVAAMSERLGGADKAEARFAQLDKNSDGSVTQEEFSAGMAGKGGGKKKKEN